MKNYYLNFLQGLILFVFNLLILFISPQEAFLSAVSSVNLFLNVVFPSLFPFMILVDSIFCSNFIIVLSKLFEPIMRPLFRLPGSASIALIFGYMAGYPGGAFITSKLHERGLINDVEAMRLISFSNNASPIYITGAVGTGLLKNPELGLLLLKSHVFASLLVGIIMGLVIKNVPALGEKASHPIISYIPPGTLSFERLKDSILSTLKTLAMVGAYIILFGLVIRILDSLHIIPWILNSILDVLRIFCDSWTFPKEFLVSLLSNVFYGLLELSNGIKMLSEANLPFKYALPAISLILGWGSLSVHFQVIGILNKTKIKASPYLAGKALQGIISALITYFNILL